MTPFKRRDADYWRCVSNGLSILETAEALGVKRTTVWRWSKRHPDAKFAGKCGQHMRERWKDPALRAKMTAGYREAAAKRGVSEEWKRRKRRIEIAHHAFKLIGIDTSMERTIGTLMRKHVPAEMKLRCGRGGKAF